MSQLLEDRQWELVAGVFLDTISSALPGERDLMTSSEQEWDAGDMGCGDLVLELRARVGSLGPGEVLKLIARDPGAPADVPAWCRLTGHRLVSGHHPVYLIQRKEN